MNIVAGKWLEPRSVCTKVEGKWIEHYVEKETAVYCYRGVRVTRQRSGLEPAVWFGLVLCPVTILNCFLFLGLLPRLERIPLCLDRVVSEPFIQFYCSTMFSCNKVSKLWSHPDVISTSIVEFELLFHLPRSYLWSDQYSLNRCEITWCIPRNCRVFDTNSTNMGPIPNLTLGDERPANTAHCMYWSWHDMIRNPIHNWMKHCEHEMPCFRW